MEPEFKFDKDLPSTDPLLIEERSSKTTIISKDHEGSIDNGCPRGWRSCCFRNKKKMVIVAGSVMGVILLLILTAIVVVFLLPSILNSNNNNLIPIKLNQEMQINYSYPLEAFAGHWRMVSQTNLDKVLEVLGSGFFVRLIAPSIPSEYEITVYGPTRATLVTKEYYTVTKEIIFDEEVEDTTNDGRNVKAINTMEGKLWVKNERWEVDGEEKYCKTVAEVILDDHGIMKIIGSIYAGDVISVRAYVRIE